jgi:uncharacterized protein (TIGR00369 family)
MASIEDINALFNEAWEGNSLQIDQVGEQQSKVRKTPARQDLRPGNTVSGPFMMALADAAMYAAVLGEIGLQPMAVTSNLNINFLRKPKANVDVIGHCKLIKVGKQLAVGEVSLFSDGDSKPIAHAVVTYAIPRQ